ncbi:hypothetical protein llg_30440 [Luteolibacter sp. LG18]|nr:hypothetical protein llg_30440 [Luteolibacter sp. LG18]
MLAACGACALGFLIFEHSRSSSDRLERHAAAERKALAKEPVALAAEGPVDFSKIEAFAAWSRGYRMASADERSAKVDEGLALAKARRPEFLKLIKADPERALKEAVPMVVRQDLPARLVAQLEERVRGVGALRTYANTVLPGSPVVPSVHYLELNDGVTYQAYTSGREQFLMDYKPNRSVNGVAIRPEGGMAQLALDPSPVRPLEVGERPDPALPKVEVCPVSGNSTALPADQANAAVKENEPVVEAQGQVVYLCNGSHTTIYENQLIAGEGVGGGGVGYNGPLPYVSTKALGVMRVLYIPATFPDENVAPTTEANAYNTMKDISDYYNKSSFGKLMIATTVTPCVMMPHDGKWYQANDSANGGSIDCLGLTHSDARAAAKALGYDPANYDCIIVLQSYAYGVSRGAGGWGSVGGNSVWIYSSTWREVVAHEMGHTFGLAHANFWDSTDGSNGTGNGANQEYGDDFDIMGGGSISTGHYNIAAKEQIKWFTADNLTSVAASGTYRVAAQDSNVLDPARSYGLKIVKDPLRTYYAEVRQLSDADANQPWQANGIRLEWKYPSGGGSNNQLIDTTPGSINGKADGNIIVGRTFSDFESGIHLTPVAVQPAANGNPKTVDVVVNLGQFPANQAPTLALNASATNVPVGASVTFNATASDPDGDALSYYWSYGNGDKTALPNASSITRTFSSAGQYQVTCTVSDMKGKTTVRSVVINVGTNTTFSIGGRVTKGGQPVANIPVATTGKETMTDSDGYYTLVGLAAGNYTITPRLDGYTFNGSLGSTITVGPNTADANFETVAGTVVTLTASVPTCTEDLAGSTGKFTLTRTGPTGSALAVTMQSVTGTATSADYTLAPAISSNTLTIPAGASSLDVTVTPKTDTSAEGPETVRLLMAQNASYVIGGSQEATVTILDNDTTVPKVSIVAAVPTTVENSGSPALLTVSRTGSTAAALTVNYSVTGTATSGSDFTALPGSVTIPAGASSVDIPVATVNDNASETNETVVVTLASNAAYLIEASPLNAATATLVDDDLQIITVSASDSIATEGASPADNGTFLVTRTGDTSQDLTLYYSVAGSALQGVDYVILPGSVTIPAGQNSAAVTIVPIDDGILEDDQTVTLLLGSLGSNYKLGSNATSTLTIKSNTTNKPFVSVAAAEDGFSESGTAGIFRFAVSGVVTTPFTVNYTLGGSATSGVDYVTPSGSVTITAGSGNRTFDVTLTPTNDGTAEDLEDVTVSITPSASYVTWPSSDRAAMWLYDGSLPTVFVDASSATPAEPSTGSKFTLLRTGATTDPLVVNYTMGGTATNGTDYTTLSGTATIPAGASFVDVAITPINDTTAEGTETIIMSLAPGTYSRSPLPATLYLGDNDTSTVTVGFNVAASTTSEGAGTVSIPVSLSAASANPVTVGYVVGSGSLSASNNDSSGLTAPYWVRMVRAGSTVAAYRSPDGTTWTQQGSTQTVGMGNTAFVGLCLGTNNSSASQVTATFDNVTVTPAGGSFTGTDVGYTPKPGTWSVASGTYTLKAQTNNISGSADSCYLVSQPVTGDCTITARVTGITGGASSTKAGVMIRESLFDDARHGTCALTSSSGTTFIWRSGSVTNAAGSGVDFTLASGTLTFPAGTTTLNIPVSITDDAIVETTEAVVVSLVNAGNAGLGSISQHILSISDNDVPPSQPTLGFAATASSGPEASSPVNIPVALSFAPTAPVTVDYAVTGGTAADGADYTLASGTLTFNAGETVKSIALAVVDDVVIEANKTVVIGLSNATGAVMGGNSSHTYTILNDDTPTVTVVATDATATEGPSSVDTGTFTVSRTGPATDPLTVNFTVSGTATSGSDYTAVGTSVTIPAGASSAPLTVTPLDNATAESSETVIVTLAANAAYTVGSPSAATVTIVDDDMPVVTLVATDDTATETGTTTGTFTVTRTGATTSALTVNFTVAGSATSGTDYTSIGTSVTIPAGSASKTITLTPVNDLASEGDEYVLVTLSTSSSYALGASYFASVTIEDDDFAPFVQITSPVNPGVVLPTGAGLLLEATATDDGLPSPMTYSWTKVSGPGTVTFGTAAALNTTATFSATGTYVLRFSAYDGNQTSTADQTVNVGGTDTLVAKDIGSSVSAGTYALNEGTGVHTLACRSGDLWNSADSFRFAFERAHGDVAVTARVLSVTNTSGWAKPGVMIRESLAAGSKHAFMSVTPGNGTAMQWRSSTDGSSSNSNTAGPVAPYWVRISRVGNVLTGASSADGVTWSDQSTATITMGTDTYIGLSLCANNTSSTCTATFDSFSVTPLANKGALVSAGSDQTVATSSVNLAGTVSDDGQPLSTPLLAWSQISGTGTTTFGNAAIAATSATFSASGTYVLRLTADDGWVKTFDDVTVNTAITTVSLATTDANAAEAGLNTGAFTVTRAGGSTASALTVFYTISGTATNGTDYQTLSGSVTIPAGQTSATITVTPIDDYLQETGGETSIVTLTADPTYGLNGTVTGTVTIADNDVNPVVTITSPTVASTSIPAGVGMLLEASASDDGQPSALVTTWSMVSGPGTVTFGDTHALNTTAVFSANGAYVLRLSAYDGGVTTTADVTVNVGVVAGGSFTNAGIGSPPLAGSGSVSNGTYTVSGSGADIYGTSDQCNFYYQSLTGDFDVKARLVSKSQSSSSDHTALMARASTAAGNVQATMTNESATSSSFSTYLMSRSSSGASIVTGSSVKKAAPVWLRLQRVGNVFYGYYSDDGLTWTGSGSYTLASMPATALVGFAVCNGSSNSNTALNTATFDSVSGFGYAGNIGPLVNAGADQPVLLPANATLAGTAADDGKPVSPGALTTTWSQVSGPGTTNFGNASSPSTTASFSQAGIYTLRLIGSDGEVKTFDDMVATVTSPLPVVTVSTPLPNAAEKGPVAGKFTVSRSGSTLSALTVKCSLSGTAGNSTDYSSIGSSVTIPAGASSVDVMVTPVVDATAEGDETAIFTATSDAAYTLGATVSGTVTIADLPVDAWKKTKFGASANDPLVAGDAADPDHDGVSNLMEYGLGTDPLDGKTAMPALKPGATPMALHLDLPDPTPADLTYTVEGTGLLGGSWYALAGKAGTAAWTWQASGTPRLTVGTPSGGRVGVDVGCPDSAAGSASYFLHLKVQRN